MMKGWVGCVIVLFLAGCGGHDPAEQRSDPQGGEAVAGHADHDVHDAGLDLELDDGRKWTVDEHTRGSARTMTALVREAGPIVSVEDGHALGEALEAEMDELIEGCTMTGPAHDQLHVILAALFPGIAQLKSGEDVAGLEGTRAELESVFNAYGDHFE